MSSAVSKKARIHRRWKEKAKKFGSSYKATIRDYYFRKLNTFVVLEQIKPGDRLLDVGCGNGFATAEYAQKAKFTLGLDYLPEFIQIANKKYKDLVKKGKLEFKVADVTTLEALNSFDKVTCERTLINLPTWADQKIAVEHIWRVLKPGGSLLLTEITEQGHEMLDSLRTSFGLQPVQKYWSNLYLDEQKFEKYVRKFFRIVKKARFGTYGLISKVAHPLLVAPAEPKFLAKINKKAFEVSKRVIGEDGPSHTVFYVLKKVGKVKR